MMIKKLVYVLPLAALLTGCGTKEKEQLKNELHSYKQNTLIKDGYLRAKEPADKK